MEYSWILLSITIVGTLGAIHYLCRNYNFFQRRGVTYIPPVPILGAMAPVIFRRISFADLMRKIYNFNPDAKYYGFYATTTPVILLRDLELIKTVLVKNFVAFPDRPSFIDSNEFLVTQNLFSLHGEKWRNMRNLLSSCFTSGKIKTMFALMSECAVNSTKSLLTLPTNNNGVDMKDFFTKYTNDVIAICVYGIKVDSMKDSTNKFYIYGKNILQTNMAKFVFFRTFPRLWRILNLKLINKRTSNFFKNIVRVTLAARDVEHVVHSDMIQLMMNIRDKEGRRKLNIDEIAAQMFFFFLGGFETSSTTLSFAAYEIAVNPKVQTRLRQEIDKILKESNSGEVTYETINRLEYLDAVVNEVLRFYPPTFLERVCDKSYELPPALPGEKPFVMRKGMICWIPVFAIHRDEKYYEDPDRFYPERFLNNKTYHNSFRYMSFGLGPRMCLGNRFAILKIKLLLFHLLARCELKPCAKTIIPLRFSKKDLLMKPEGGFWLNVQRRDNNTYPTSI
ncbi:cytochrome P450 9e2-like [Polyergus mexicanus]|uniref:cytochrome P450 9e2-like n=1 Tax=Polyergus mexicanus TaxID=615972 RepID=UPI0038B475DF